MKATHILFVKDEHGHGYSAVIEGSYEQCWSTYQSSYQGRDYKIEPITAAFVYGTD